MAVGAASSGSEYIIGSCKYRNEKIGVDELELLKHYAYVFDKGTKTSLLHLLTLRIYRSAFAANR